MPNKVSHLEMIQGVVNRMASNSFQLKGWCVVLVSALFALASKDTASNLVYIAFIPAITFWLLDGYFLHQERLFRSLFDSVRKPSGEESDFSMSTKPFLSGRNRWWRAMFSTTLILFHGTILAAISVAAVLLFKKP